MRKSSWVLGDERAWCQPSRMGIWSLRQQGLCWRQQEEVVVSFGNCPALTYCLHLWARDHTHSSPACTQMYACLQMSLWGRRNPWCSSELQVLWLGQVLRHALIPWFSTSDACPLVLAFRQWNERINTSVFSPSTFFVGLLGSSPVSSALGPFQTGMI